MLNELAGTLAARRNTAIIRLNEADIVKGTVIIPVPPQLYQGAQKERRCQIIAAGGVKRTDRFGDPNDSFFHDLWLLAIPQCDTQTIIQTRGNHFQIVATLTPAVNNQNSTAIASWIENFEMKCSLPFKIPSGLDVLVLDIGQLDINGGIQKITRGIASGTAISLSAWIQIEFDIIDV